MRILASDSGVPVRVGEVEMRLHPEFVTQNWETVECGVYREFAAMLRPGDVVYDIGAHIGTYTLTALAHIGAAGRVVAYEPHEYTRRHLTQHIEWSGDSQRTLIRPVCCGAAAGNATFYCVPERAEGMNGLVPVDGFQTVAVSVTTIDQEVIVLGLVPSVIKIDVEGAEWDVLKGAETTLRTHRPRISLSLHPVALRKSGATPQAVLDWLTGCGYRHRIVSEDHELHVIADTAPPVP